MWLLISLAVGAPVGVIIVLLRIMPRQQPPVETRSPWLEDFDSDWRTRW